MRTIGVGYRDTPRDRLVLDTARELAWRLDAELRAAWVVPESNWPDASSGMGTKALTAQRRLAEIPGVHGVALEGDVLRALRGFALEVDLLVIGTPGWRLRNGLLGHVDCPLLVVPTRSG